MQSSLHKIFLVCLVVLSSSLSNTVLAQATAPATVPADWGPVSISLEEVPYPYPVSFLNRNLYGQDVRIAYMDVAPTGTANGRSAILLHGSSYYGWYWKDTIAALSAAGFRVVTIDRLGWGRSSKPIIPYDISLHASNVRAIMESLGIEQAALIGHSLGGRLGSYYAFAYPELFTHLVMVNPISLNDSTRGRTWQEPSSGNLAPNPQEFYAQHLGQEQRRVVEWKPEFLEHVRIRYGHSLSSEFPRLNLVRALNSGLTAEPITSFWPKITTRAMLIGGAEDGENYPATAAKAVDLLPNGELFMIPNVGHNPHLESPEILNRELIRFLNDGPGSS